MVKLMIIFKHPEDTDRFEAGYVRSLALLEKMDGIQRQQANMILGNPEGHSPYYRILELYFEDYSALDIAMRSPAGIEAGQSLMTFAGNIVDVLFVDVFEDDFSEQSE